eukprot:2313935-Rhodomonas_salina.2
MVSGWLSEQATLRTCGRRHWGFIGTDSAGVSGVCSRSRRGLGPRHGLLQFSTNRTEYPDLFPSHHIQYPVCEYHHRYPYHVVRVTTTSRHESVQGVLARSIYGGTGYQHQKLDLQKTNKSGDRS